MTLQPWLDAAEREHLRTVGEEVLLIGVRCAACQRIDFPAVPFCRNCLDDRLVEEPIASIGALYAFTRIHTAESPYVVGYVDLPTGLRVFGRVEGSAAIGDLVSVRDARLPLTFVATRSGASIDD